MSSVKAYLRAAVVVGIAGVIVWLGGCSDNPAGLDCCDLPQAPIVSDPVTVANLLAGGSGYLAPTGAAADDVTYVTLPPGTAPSGSVAFLRRVGDTKSIETRVYDGGFDPVAIVAQAGDSIDIQVTDAAEQTVFELRVEVVAKRPPLVVRTNPPRKKRDVPLNAAVVVVFSEPIDPATLTASTVQLRRGNTVVAGDLAFRDAEHLTAVFTPAALLATNTEYTLTVTQGIRDLDGDPLETAVTVSFTTSASAPEYQEYFVDGGAYAWADQVGDSVYAQFEADVKDGTGARIEGALVRFRGSIGTVSPEATTSGFAGVTPVAWRFLGLLGGPGPEAVLSACASNSPTRCDMYWPVLVLGLRGP